MAIEENHTHYAPTAGNFPYDKQSGLFFLKEKYDLGFTPDSAI